MRIDLQIPAHLDKEVAADLFLSILEGSEFSSEIQTTMASLSLVGHKFAADLLPPGEPAQPTTRIPHPSRCYGRTVLSECQARAGCLAVLGDPTRGRVSRGAKPGPQSAVKRYEQYSVDRLKPDRKSTRLNSSHL